MTTIAKHKNIKGFKTLNPLLNAFKKHQTFTENGAISNEINSEVLNYFAHAGTYRLRSQTDVDLDMSKIFSEDPILATIILAYNRMITREIEKNNSEITETVQKGQGTRSEFISALIYMRENQFEYYQKLISHISEFGRVDDLFFDSPVPNSPIFYADDEFSLSVIKSWIENPIIAPKLAKYLPAYQHKFYEDRKISIEYIQIS